MCLLYLPKVVVRRINRQCQLRNGWRGSDEDNGDTNHDDDNVQMTTMTTTTMVAGSVGINAGTGAAAALHQGLMTQSKRSQRKRGHQCLTTTGIETLQQ